MEKPTICRYCGSPVVFTSNAEIYGREYGDGKCYLCRNCKAFVGVHPGTDTPLGTLANAELREWRKPLRITTRYKAYGWLAEQLHISREYTHIGMFEKEECEETIRLSKIRIEKYKKQRSEIFEWI